MSGGDLVCVHCGKPIYVNGPFWSHFTIYDTVECQPNFAEPRRVS